MLMGSNRKGGKMMMQNRKRLRLEVISKKGENERDPRRDWESCPWMCAGAPTVSHLSRENPQ